MMTRRCLFFFLALVLGGWPKARAEEWVSGDGRFALRQQNENNDFALVEVQSGKPVMGTEELVHSADGSIATVWAKDSQQVAVNFRSGARYEATQLYVWKGEQFAPRKDLFDVLSRRVEAERAAQVKRLKLPAKTKLRRIWDTHRTLRWRDAQTVEVYVRSERQYLKDEDAEEPESIVIAGVYTVRYDKKGEPKIIDRREPTEKEAEG